MKRLTIKQKISTAIMSASIVIFGIILFYLFFEVKPRNEEEVAFLIQQNIETKASDVSQWIEKRVVEYRTLSIIPAIKSMDVRKITPIIDEISNSYNERGNGMEAFSFIGNNGFAWINSEATEKLIRYEDYTKAYTSEQEFIIGHPIVNQDNREVILFYYPIKGYTGLKESLICASVPLVRIQELVNTLQLYDGKTWIMTKQHKIISTNENYLYENTISKEILETIELSDLTTSVVVEVEGIHGKGKLFVSLVPSYNDWVVVTFVTNQRIHRSTNEVILGCFALLIFLLILTFFLTHYLGVSILKPIKLLQTKMKRVETGDLTSYYPNEDYPDEIQALGLSFNTMLDDIKRLIDKVYLERKEKEYAEYEILQAQIKPHFLYNALDNIKWMAKKQQADDVSKSITDLSTFFRISLSKGAMMIPLKDEFKFTKSYLDIQKIRFQDQFTYSLYIDPVLEQMMVPKMILQPFIENAIIHGIKDCDRTNTLTCEALLVDCDLVIVIEDDGLGMNESHRQAISNYISQSTNNSDHYGMRNVYMRLSHSFGHRVSIQIDSQLHLGTRIKITIKEFNHV